MSNIKKIINCLFLVFLCSVNGQRPYTQKYIDTFQMGTITEEKLNSLKNVLSRDKSLEGWTKYYAFKGYYHFRNLEKDSAIFYANKAIDTYSSGEDKNLYQKCTLEKAYFILGYYARVDGNFRLAVDFCLQGIEISHHYRKLYGRESKYLPYFQRDVANSYIKMGYLSSAKKYYKYLMNNSWYMDRAGWNVLNKLGLVAQYQSQLDSAKYYYHKGLDLVEDRFKE
ncbi:MAG: hypothetical protein AAFX53_10950, partial [Bacteroidota bacterium]